VADVATARPSSLAAYRVLVGSRVRSQVSYRTSFAVDVLASLLLAVVELAEVYVIFHNVDVLGGLDLPAALLVFGLSHLGFAVANAVAGTLDTMPTYIRTGTLEALMLRPQPVLAQVLTGEVTLKRLGAASVGLVTLAAAVAVQDVDWTPARVVLLVTTPLCAAVVFASLFLAAGALQFWLVDAAEVTHSFTYGSAYASSFSSAVLPQPLRWAFAFVVPAAFTAYLPALAILGLPGPAGLPAWLGWCTPVVAALSAVAALGLWRLGIRHYTGAGG
jgi:ABC-2 type transport system permease protein